MSDQLDTKTGWLSPDQLENIRANVPLITTAKSRKRTSAIVSICL